MARPSRPIWTPRSYARRRHRSWMLSMTLASLGWGTWWLMLLGRKLFHLEPTLLVPGLLSTVFAVLGLIVALWCFRARRAWMLFVLIPILANASLLALPWLASDMTF